MKCTLNDLCDIITDGTHQTPEYCGNEGVLFLSSKDVVARKIDWEHAKYIPRSLHDILSSRLTPQRNDILLAKNGTTGVAALVDCEKTFDIYVSLALLRPKKSINPKFLLHAINSPTSKRQFNAGLKGIGVPNLHLNVIKNTIIDVPSESEQSQIADCLDTIERLNNSRKQQLAKLDTLVKSRFIEMFGDPVTNPHGWEKVPLADLAELKIGPFGTMLHKEDYITGGHPLVNPSHIHEGKIFIDEKLTISDEKYEELSAYHLVDNDVVMGRRGEMGRCAVVKSSGLLCGTGSMIIRSFGEVRADFLQKIISFPTFKKTIEDMAVGQTMPNLNVQIVSRFKIIKPPAEVQNAYYDFVAQADKSKSVLQKLLEKQELLRAALMQEYFG